LIVSPLFLHWTNDLPGALIQMRQALKPDGLLLACVFGGESLRELRACLLEAECAATGGAGARIAPFGDARDFASLLQRAGLALPVTDLDRVTVSYRDPFKLFADLREMGERNAMAAPAPPLTRSILLDAMTRYARTHAQEDGRVRATFDLITLTGWAPAPSQPKPLRPGSAQVRLATALGVTEHQTGERAAPPIDGKS
jgi:SAM-dependent methyltransferase